MSHRRVAVAFAVLLAAFVAPSGSASSTDERLPATPKTFVVPHILESKGTVDRASNAFDTTIYATYTGGILGGPYGGGATVSVYLFDDAGGHLMSATGGTVCNPCHLTFNASVRSAALSIDAAIRACGGFASKTQAGFAVIEVGGADPLGVNMDYKIINSHSNPADQSVFESVPQPFASSSSYRSFVIPHFLEKKGTVARADHTFDTTIFATYTGGLSPSTSDLGGATVDVYLVDHISGNPMMSSTSQPVCDPCSYPVDSSHRKVKVKMEDLIKDAGGFPNTTIVGFAVIVVGGIDPDAVNMQGFTVNSHTSAFDVSVFGFTPQPMESSP